MRTDRLRARARARGRTHACPPVRCRSSPILDTPKCSSHRSGARRRRLTGKLHVYARARARATTVFFLFSGSARKVSYDILSRTNERRTMRIRVRRGTDWLGSFLAISPRLPQRHLPLADAAPAAVRPRTNPSVPAAAVSSPAARISAGYACDTHEYRRRDLVNGLLNELVALSVSRLINFL